ncbi:MAG: HD domain-containing phosphohydrolase [Halieaceae bacterium]
MSIRLQQLLLLLAIALLPVLIAGLQSQSQIDDMAAQIAVTARQQELLRERHYLREKVADLGTSLRLVGRNTEDLLRRQALSLEQALRAPAPASALAILDSRRLEGVDTSQPSFLLADAGCAAGNCELTLQQLAASGTELRALHAQAEQNSLWHYAGLDNGVSMVYPAHGNYPVDYDPRDRPWYRAAIAAAEPVWLPLTIDASTGQPVLTATTALRDAAGNSVGATAIDLPLRKLLNFHSSAAPWLDVARLALVRLDSAGQLVVVAMKEPLDRNIDWRGPEQSLQLDSIDAAHINAMLQLNRGESRFFEKIALAGDNYHVAVTALNDRGDNWLALISPHSASEAAVARALAFVEDVRTASMREHFISALLLVIVVSLIALFAANRVTRPLIQMSDTAGALADGKLDSRTGLVRSDELGTLSASIDRMADSIEQLQLDQEQAYRDMLMSLHRALEKKDAYTAGHSGRVTRTALQLGQRMGLDESTLDILRFGALTHDLGKIGIADAILNKPAALDPAEKEIMKQHPVFSKTIMQPLVRFAEYAEIAGSHHEHWDGSGYPEGLKGEEIHLLARIVGIADTWDSMIGDRVYRKGMPQEKALAILEAEQDSGQFDPELIREFLAMVRESRQAS